MSVQTRNTVLAIAGAVVVGLVIIFVVRETIEYVVEHPVRASLIALAIGGGIYLYRKI